MSTATVDFVSDGWTDQEVNDNVRAVIDVLLRIHRLEPLALAKHLNMPKSTLYNRLKPTGHWSAAEIYRLAKVLDVQPGAFFRPAGEFNAALAGLAQNWKILNPGLRAIPTSGQMELALDILPPQLQPVYIHP